MKALQMRMSSAGLMRTMRLSSTIATLAFIVVDPGGAVELVVPEVLDVLFWLFSSLCFFRHSDASWPFLSQYEHFLPGS